MKRINYFKRIFKVYFTSDKGYLSFWHEKPEASKDIDKDHIGVYYQTFKDKAKYDGPRDENGIIMFDYYFDIGRQYNPLAIAQYGLGRYNLWRIKNKESRIEEANEHLEEAKKHADWLVENLEPNDAGLMVWKHKFPWHYKENLMPGWYSAHSQGTGISLLARMYKSTGEGKYLEVAKSAFEALDKEIAAGGTKYVDSEGNAWLEEYIIKEPTHILNGFLWALWGVYDYWLLTGDERGRKLFDACIATLEKNLPRYDAGFWSLYDLSRQAMKMIASPFYHSLHIAQLKATYALSGKKAFKVYADKFEKYQRNWLYRKVAWIYKAVFKLLYF